MEDSITYKKDENFIPSITLESHLDQLQEIKSWLTKKGFNPSNSRIIHYIKFLELFISNDDFDPKNNEQDKETFDEMLYVLREVHELMWIYNSFKDVYPEGSDELIKRIIGGQAFARDDKDTSARNYQFELRIASYFIRANYIVELQHITDVVAKKSKFKFFIECKRLSSPKKIESRIKEAAKQLELKTKKRMLLSKDLGIAVFDVTKIAFPHQGLTFGMTYEHCKDIIQDKLKEISREYDFETPFIKNKNVILVWLQIHIPSLHILNSHPTTRFSSLFIPLVPNSGYRSDAFEQLKEVIEVSPYAM